MATLYVAFSKGLAKWASDVGQSKHVYKIGLAEDGADSAIAALNAAQYARESDWRLSGKLDGVTDDELAVLARIAVKEKAIDANYYPRLKGTNGLFKVKPTNVEDDILVRQAMAGQSPRLASIKTADIVAYLLATATGPAQGT